MKTIRLEGRALDLARELSFISKEGVKRIEQMQQDIADVQNTVQKEMKAKLAQILEAVCVDKSAVGQIDGTYLEDHGLAFLQIHDRPSVSDILEDVVAAAVAPQETVQ